MKLVSSLRSSKRYHFLSFLAFFVFIFTMSPAHASAFQLLGSVKDGGGTISSTSSGTSGNYILTIAENDYNIAVSSYVVGEDMHEVADITELNERIIRIVNRQNELRTAIDEIVADIEGIKRNNMHKIFL